MHIQLEPQRVHLPLFLALRGGLGSEPPPVLSCSVADGGCWDGGLWSANKSWLHHMIVAPAADVPVGGGGRQGQGGELLVGNEGGGGSGGWQKESVL